VRVGDDPEGKVACSKYCHYICLLGLRVTARNNSVEGQSGLVFGLLIAALYGTCKQREFVLVAVPAAFCTNAGV
jgi:hypothetical protein